MNNSTRRNLSPYKTKLNTFVNNIWSWLRKLKAEIYVSVVATVTAIYSLLFSIDESKKTAELNYQSIKLSKQTFDEAFQNYRLSVVPSVIFTININSTDPLYDFLGIEIENRGLGPALFSPPVLFYDGKVIGLFDIPSFNQIKKVLNMPDSIVMLQVHSYLTLLPGEKRKIFWSENKKSHVIEKYFQEALKHVNIVIGYSSVYQDIIFFNVSQPCNDSKKLVDEAQRFITLDKLPQLSYPIEIYDSLIDEKN